MVGRKERALKLERAIKRAQKADKRNQKARRIEALREMAAANRAAAGADSIGFVVDVVPNDWIVSLNEKIVGLGDDISAQRKKDKRGCDAAQTTDEILKECGKSNESYKLALEYHPFWFAWGKWVEDNIGVFSGFGEKSKAEFFQFEAGYNSFLKRFKAIGGKTHQTGSNASEGIDLGDLVSGSGTSTLLLVGAVAAAFLLLRK